MARKITASLAIRLRQAKKLDRAHEHAIRTGFPLTHKFDVNWKYTRFQDQPFGGVKHTIEAARKWLQRHGVTCVAFVWVRERPSKDECEGAHVAFHCPKLADELREYIFKTIGGFDPRALKHTAFKNEPRCNSRTWVTGYILKGGTDAVRDKYPSARNRKWSRYQGEIIGKRIGISETLNAKAIAAHYAAGLTRGLISAPVRAPAHARVMRS